MINPQTVPSSIDRLFHVAVPIIPTPPPTNYLLGKTHPTVSNTATTITSAMPLDMATPNNGISIAPKSNGLSTGWWIMIAVGTGLGIGILVHELSKNKGRKKQK